MPCHEAGLWETRLGVPRFPWMRTIAGPFIALLALAACRTADTARPESEAPVAALGSPAIPTGATRSPAGFLTIREAPPAAFPADPPPPPATLDSFARRTALGTEDGRAREWEAANGPEDFQQEVRRLMGLLPRAEAGNFVQLRLARDETSSRDPKPLLGAEVWFKRNAARTLAKYTRDPRFFAKEGGLSEADLSELQNMWIERLQPLGIASGVSGDPTTGVVSVELGVTEARFRAIAAEQEWTWGSEVRFVYAPEQPPAFREPALAAQVRAFAREGAFSTIRLLALGTGRIVLEDGCFRMADAARNGPLVMFAYDAQLARDAEGYLTMTTPGETTGYRIGEEGAWGGPNFVDETWPDVKRLRAACGEGRIVNVAQPQSLRSFALPYADWVLDYAQVNGLTYDAAWDQIMACMTRAERAGKKGLAAREACVTQFNRKGIPGEARHPEPPRR